MHSLTLTPSLSLSLSLFALFIICLPAPSAPSLTSLLLPSLGLSACTLPSALPCHGRLPAHLLLLLLLLVAAAGPWEVLAAVRELDPFYFSWLLPLHIRRLSSMCGSFARSLPVQVLLEAAPSSPLLPPHSRPNLRSRIKSIEIAFPGSSKNAHSRCRAVSNSGVGHHLASRLRASTQIHSFTHWQRMSKTEREAPD